VTALVNAGDGTVVGNYEYGPFGEVIRSTGPMAKVNPIRFSTKYQDDESDLLYYGYRYYKASTGTWVSRDPVSELGFKVVRSGLVSGGKPTVRVFNKRTNSFSNKALMSQAGQGGDYCFLRDCPISAIDALGLFTFDGCTPEQQDQIKKSISDNCDKAKACAGKCATGGPADGVKALCESKYQGYVFHCRKEGYVAPDGTKCDDNCGFTDPNGTEITLCASAWDQSSCDGIQCTLFHESLHGAGQMPMGPGTTHPPDFATFDKCMGCSVTYPVGK
jgi:RHS repeat-associated protein